jgi:hypothetical protein|tara:strand:+ start:11518 stop:11718 length:201 start_codon:yes stop_codon:yes gene_type:complete
MKNKSTLDWAIFVLVVVGALNWGAIGAFDTDVVADVLGAGSVGADVLYVLIGLAGLYMVYMASKKR